LGKIYSILSDDEKKKIYDETGKIDGEDFEDRTKDWDEYFRTMFKKINTKDIEDFYEKYKDSEEERSDLIKYYEEFEGDFDLILENMFSSNSIEDEPRFRNILNSLIDKGEIKSYELFVKESKKKAKKRANIYEKEAIEAEKLRKEMNVDENQDCLKSMILARRQAANESFLDNLAKKYSNDKSNRQDKKSSKTKNEEIYSDSDESTESNEQNSLKSKKRSKLVKRKVSNMSSKSKVKVKRL
jgi:DnaJ family protein C protein 9